MMMINQTTSTTLSIILCSYTRSLNCLDRVDLSVTTSLSAVSLSVMSQNRVKASRTDFWTLPSFVLRLGVILQNSLTMP
ncbi:uncharacterized protein BJ212DRAFT_1309866 [Suillus subaureus]|uniref:Uncharacterized protein n=1 Tax=Suillus subaureus TaxID=48587 RepID=A0A9P7EP96_9AGAM|nr:uncharacterized protein BJ212DRAFT_1309866 [Suillus subaureus]KAG1827012.1 hypothetical protein BJ212DRAFT_1309866 [Suillus subaureus]